jgi:hypothetical protein
MKAFYSAVCATAALILPQASGLYFYLERDIQKCFKDELVKNSVSVTIKLRVCWRNAPFLA